MRVALFSAAVLLAMACGGSEGVSGPEVFGGFTPMDGSAVILAPDSCDISFVGISGVSGIAIVLGDHPDMCGVLQQTNLCGTKANSKALLGVAINGKVGTDPVDPVGPGTYRFLVEPPTGSFKAALADAAQVDASCESVLEKGMDMSGGSITIDSVTAERVMGSMNVAFDNGEVYAQPFDVAICSITKDVCDLFGYGSCTNRTCVE